jgi:hypothetical protein
MQNIPWNALATYNGRATTLLEGVRSWRRDAQRTTGAIGSLTTNELVELDGWKRPATDLSTAQCWDLADLVRRQRL